MNILQTLLLLAVFFLLVSNCSIHILAGLLYFLLYPWLETIYSCSDGFRIEVNFIEKKKYRTPYFVNNEWDFLCFTKFWSGQLLKAFATEWIRNIISLSSGYHSIAKRPPYTSWSQVRKFLLALVLPPLVGTHNKGTTYIIHEAEWAP